MKRNSHFTIVLTVILLIIGISAPTGQAAQLQNGVNAIEATYTIDPVNLQGWYFYNPTETGLWNFPIGPGTPPVGLGSFRFEIPANDVMLFYRWGLYVGSKFSDFTSLSYSTYQDPTSLGNVNQLPVLAIVYDDDITSGATESGTLFYEPYRTPGNTPVKGAWQTWNTRLGRWWATGTLEGVCPPTAPCLWNDLIAAYPNIGISSLNPEIWFQVGAGFGVEPDWESGFIGNIDNFIIGTDTYNFDPSNPVAYNQRVTTPEDTSKAITLTAADPEGSPLIWSVITNPAHGTLSGTAPNLTYTPAANYNGSDSFTFVVYDNLSVGSNTATVWITVTPVNDPPVANSQSVTTDENTPKAITLTASDPDNDPLTWIIVTNPAHGSLSGTAPNLTYTPTTNYSGSDSFTFKVNDGVIDSNTATVSITVDPVNRAPVANNQSVTTAEDTSRAITLTASDPDSDPLSWIIVANPAHGSLSGTPPNVTYNPTANYNGSDSFTFKVNDGALDSNIATVSITVTPVDDAPVANPQSVTTAEDTAKAITLTATEVDGDPLTWQIRSNPTHGTLSGTAPNLTYTPNANYNGSDSFTFRVNDGKTNSNTATVSITVTPVNDAPVANNQSVTTAEDTAKAITLTASDVEGDPLTWSIVANPAHGTLSGTPPNVTYNPAANYNGSDSFTFRVNDGTTNSNTATVSITVTPVDDVPVANNQSVTTAEDTSKAITLTATEVDGDPLTWAILDTPDHGSLSGTPPNVTYNPATNYNGSDSFTFRVNDGTTNSNIATVSITVTPVNDAPIANSQSVTTAEDTPKSITLTASDVEGSPLTWSIVANPAHGALSGTLPNVIYTPAANYHGSDSFTFRVNDGTTNSNTATVTITVTPVNDAPVANAQSVTVVEDTPKSITLTASDVEGNPLTWSIVDNPAHGTLSGTAPNLTYTPDANYYGSDSFTFKVSDSILESDTATVSILVTPVNDAPLALDDEYTMDGNTVLNEAAPGVLGNDSDIEDDSLTAILDVGPTHGTLILNSDGSFVYTPDTNYIGEDSFTYHTNDGALNSDIVTVTITIDQIKLYLPIIHR